VAGAIGLALLVGGGSTFAYWSDSVPKSVGTVDTGALDMDDPQVVAYDVSIDNTGNVPTTLGKEGTELASDNFLNGIKAVPKDAFEIDFESAITVAGTDLGATLTVTSDGDKITDLPDDWDIRYWIIENDVFVVGDNGVGVEDGHMGLGEDARGLVTGEGLTYTIPDTLYSTSVPVNYKIAILITCDNDPGDADKSHPAPTEPETIPFGTLTFMLAQADRVASVAT
jgi:predicted ribosomally synthesized peptide with SipW-like signal peptide